MPIGVRQDPYPGYNFAIEIDDVVQAGCTEVSGLHIEIEVTPYREGGVNGYLHMRAGPAKYPSNLKVRKGVTVEHELWDWYWQVTQGVIKRKNISVLLWDSCGEEKRRWTFQNAYPMNWLGPDLNANVNQVAFESLEFVHGGLQKP